jgi:hypothetical protein
MSSSFSSRHSEPAHELMCGQLLQSHRVLATSQRPTPQSHPPVLPAFRNWTPSSCASRAAVRVVVPQLSSPGWPYWGPITDWIRSSRTWTSSTLSSSIRAALGAMNTLRATFADGGLATRPA